MNHRFFICLAALAGFSLSACSISTILPEPAPAKQIYRLSSDAPATELAFASGPVSAQSNGYTVRVDRPNATKALRGLNLIVVQDDNRLVSIAGAEWADSLPTLVQKTFISHLDARSGITGLLPTSGARTDYRAHITIRNFEANFDQGESAAPRVIVDYLVTLSNASTRNLIGTETFRVENRANSKRVSDIVETMSGANETALRQISDWITSRLSVQAG